MVESGAEFSAVQFEREITHTINMFFELSTVLKNYVRDPDNANKRVINLMDYL